MKQTSREERPQIEIKRNAKLSTEGMKRESENGNIQMTIYTIYTIYILYISKRVLMESQVNIVKRNCECGAQIVTPRGGNMVWEDI